MIILVSAIQSIRIVLKNQIHPKLMDMFVACMKSSFRQRLNRLIKISNFRLFPRFTIVQKKEILSILKKLFRTKINSRC